jgi:hypothetical protein
MSPRMVSRPSRRIRRWTRKGSIWPRTPPAGCLPCSVLQFCKLPVSISAFGPQRGRRGIWFSKRTDTPVLLPSPENVSQVSAGKSRGSAFTSTGPRAILSVLLPSEQSTADLRRVRFEDGGWRPRDSCRSSGVATAWCARPMWFAPLRGKMYDSTSGSIHSTTF